MNKPELKQVAFRIDPVFYEGLQNYLKATGTTITDYGYAALRNAFISSLESDQRFLDLVNRNLEESENYGLTPQHIEDLERQKRVLSARVESFSEIYLDLIADREASYAEA